MVNGAGGAKDFVESSALLKTSEDNGRCMVISTLLQSVTAMCLRVTWYLTYIAPIM